MKLFRNQPFLRMLVAYVILAHLLQLCFPLEGFALTSGPSTPEVSGFSPIGATERVNLFTGDYSENIPLMDIEGYPLNISYSSNIGMDQEASCVGLGWSINPGNISRTMRGLPDDFKGDKIKQEYNVRTNITLGITAELGLELLGKKTDETLGKLLSFLKKGSPSITPSFGISYNNYYGLGLSVGVNPSFQIHQNNSTTLTAGLGFAASTQSGLSVSPDLTMHRNLGKVTKNEWRLNQSKISVSSNINSRAGLQALSFGYSFKQGYINWSSLSLGVRSANGGMPITFATPTYTPQASFPFVNTSGRFNTKLGGEFLMAHPNHGINAHFSKQKLRNNGNQTQSYGYLYAEESVNLGTAILDFNREKDGSFIKKATTNLPLTNLTYDTYHASGQGMHGMFRPHRNSPGVVYDKAVLSSGGGGTLGGEIGGGNLIHIGGNIGFHVSDTYAGIWRNHDELSPKFKFTGKNSDPTYESVYFKNAGEKAAIDDLAFYSNIGGESAVRPLLSRAILSRPKVENGFVNRFGSTFSANSYVRQGRDKRNQVFNWLTASDAQQLGLEKAISSFAENTGYVNSQLQQTNISRVGGHRKGHHMSQIEVLRPDGMRYFYGFPVYNNKKREVSFNVSGQPANCADGLVDYQAGIDNSINNERGVDHFFSATETPGYAYSYLLTAVVSDNYVDKDGVEGPSDGDLGSWHKINYSRVHENYKWRVPFQQNKANYNEGFKTHDLDDKGSYVYGEKEITYVHFIESRHYIALFDYSRRFDGYGVLGENGGIDTTQWLRKLDKVTLYSKKDLLEKGDQAFPIKTVHLEYDYSLCPDVPNNINFGNSSAPVSDKGKLTLQKLYFTYGNSQQAGLSPYEFHYADPDFNGTLDADYNPSYSLKGYDRWGNYKPNPGCSSTQIPNAEFPYVDQSLATGNPSIDRLTDMYAKAWLMTWMKMPSGGTLKISYEADEYAYVQHLNAMQMVKVAGVGKTKSATPLPTLIDPSNNANFNYVFLDLPIGVSSDQEFRDTYLKGLHDTTWLYFNFFTRITPDASEYEYVTGFVQFDDAGVSSSNPNLGWIKVKAVGIKDNNRGQEVQPMAKAAWNFVRMNLPWKIFKGQAPRGTGQSAVQGLLAFGMDFKTFFTGFNRTLRKDKYGTIFNPDKSWMRLTTPDGMKHGGGVRVSKIELNDSWDQMAGGQDRNYGQEFVYSTTACDGNAISSGVAA